MFSQSSIVEALSNRLVATRVCYISFNPPTHTYQSRKTENIIHLSRKHARITEFIVCDTSKHANTQPFILHNPQTTSGSTVSSSSSSLLQSQDFLRGVGARVRARVRDLVGVGVTLRSLLDPPDGTFTDFREVSVWDRLSSTRFVRWDSDLSLEPTFPSSASWRELPSLGFM